MGILIASPVITMNKRLPRSMSTTKRLTLTNMVIAMIRFVIHLKRLST